MMGNTDDMLSFNNLYEQDVHDNNSGLVDGTDVNFTYSDTDTHFNEIAELYSYTEQNEFQLNVKAFEDEMDGFNLAPCWQKLSKDQQRDIIMKLIDQLEHSSKSIRMKSARCILYLAQGCWAEVQSDKEQYQLSRINVMMLYELGAFSAFVELLNFESSKSTNTPLRKVVLSLADCEDLRVILSVLYIITEVIRYEKETESEEFANIIDSFSQEILTPVDDEILIARLLGMITKFCSGVAPHFPIKKILLLLWKISLVGLGGMSDIKKLKNDYRARAGLSPAKEDTLEVGKLMRASSPPTIASDVLDNQNPKRNRPIRRVRTNDMLQESLMKQSSLDEQEQINIEMESQCPPEGEEELSDYYRTYDDPSSMNSNGQSDMQGGNGMENGSENPDNGINGKPRSFDNWMSEQPPMKTINRLPWEPKVRQKDVDQFLDLSRHKFLGYTLIDDRESIVGLPRPIREGIKTLKEHMYISLADLQVKKEEEIARNPISTFEGEIEMTPAEIVYQAILPNLPQCMIALLKILLAASPTSKSKTETINIMVDVFPEELPVTVIQSTKLGIDVNRHKEIIVKAVSAILLLYLKHFKLNHIYQFEYMSQHLVFANCIPLVLKFFNQNIMCYVGSKNTIPIMDFPACVIGEQPEMTSESLVIGDSAAYTWRNIFSCVNLLRILNKLTKSKHSRIMMLVVFKSAPILKRTLKVRYGLMQLYVLKLLKMQTKYLGRQWRKCNMKTISAIYLKVRHRFNDDWAFGNDLDARPWDFQAEECTLRTCVDRFNSRRYPNWNRNLNNNINNGLGIGGAGQQQQQQNNNGINDFHSEGLDCLLELCDKGAMELKNSWDENIELSDEFKEHYELWLEEEVFNNDIDWDLLMVPVA